MLHRPGLAAHAAVLILIAVAGAFTPPARAQIQVPSPAAAAGGAPSATAPQAAIPDDPYTVGGVEVDVTATSAAEAREKAILEAQRKAFAVLFKRLAADGATRIPPAVGTPDLQRMIQGFEIERERGSAVRYVGALSFKFRRKAVRNYLSGLGVRVIEPAQRQASGPDSAANSPPPLPTATPAEGLRPTVVLPVTQTRNAAQLWEERTPWRSAWEDFAAAAGAAKIVVPPGELTDIADIGANEAVAGDATSLARIAAHYNAGDVVVAVLPADFMLTAAAGGAGSPIPISRYDAGGQPQGPADSVTLTATMTEKPEALLGRAVSAVVQRLASLPTRASTPATPPPPPPSADADLAAGVPITGMPDWLEIRRRLTSNPMVASVETTSLARSRVDVVIRFRGDQEALRAMLDRDNLTLASTPSGWMLYLKSSAPGGTNPIPSTAPQSSSPRPLSPAPLSPPAPLAGYPPTATPAPAPTPARRTAPESEYDPVPGAGLAPEPYPYPQPEPEPDQSIRDSRDPYSPAPYRP